MGTRGLFIGVNRHADPGVSELRGAVRDAKALHALLTDTLPDLVSTRLLDAEATRDRILVELQGTLGNAGPDDVILLSYSGHGTRSHRLVPHDFDRSRAQETSIGMDQLAGLFKSSRARAVLFILDCCFSGGANARVIHDSPAPKDVLAGLDTVIGEGRILLAASNVNEPAWESPGTGHGLLTKAIIDTLLAASGAVDVQVAMAEIMTVVRVEAQRIGVVQTPVLVGYVTGGLSMPALRRGPAFAAAFPEFGTLKAAREIRSLAAFGLPPGVLDAWQAIFTNGLNELQLRAVNEGRVLDGESLAVVAPTSAGKTFIGEMAAVRAIAEGKKAVFLLPYRALVAEKFDRFTHQYAAPLGLRVLRCSGDYQDDAGNFVLGRYDLAILTFEMFLQLAAYKPHVLDALGLVVLDEAQFITDPNRGITVELLLTMLIAARSRGVAPQLVVLSAVIGAVNDFDAWLGATLLVHEKRPVPLTEGVLDRTGTFVYRDEHGLRKEVQFVPGRSITQRRGKPNTQDVLVPLARQLVGAGETLLVFRSKRGSARGAAKYLANELGLPPATEALARNGLSASSASEDLRACLRGGTAFHTTDLSAEEKALVEREFRRKDGPVRAVVATTTLAAGVNTPASTVVIAEHRFLGEDGRPFTVAEYKNMAGRAGRLEYRPEGRSIILAETWHERERLFSTYVMGVPEPMRSSFEPGSLPTWLLRLLSHVHQVGRDEVGALLANTYGGYLEGRRDPTWGNRIAIELNDIVDRLLSLQLAEQEEDRIQLTLLGRACGRSSLSFESCMRLVELLRMVGAHTLDGPTLMALVQLLPESDGGYTPMMRKGNAERTRSQDASARYGSDIARTLQRYAKDDWDWLARCKRAAILWDWISGVPTEAIERMYSPNPYQGTISLGDIVKFADATRFHLRSAHGIASVMMLPGCPTDQEVDELLRQLQVGIPRDALDLLALPLTLERTAYLALRAQGITTPAQLRELPPDRVRAILGDAPTERLVSAGLLAAVSDDSST